MLEWGSGKSLPRYRLRMRTLTMPFPIFKRGGIVGVRIAIVAEMWTGINVAWAPKSVPKTLRFLDIFSGYHLKGRK